MSKLRVLSGNDLIVVFSKFGFFVALQKGSHIKLKRILGTASQIITIPNHKEIDKGTLKAIYNQALKYLTESDLAEHFYTK